MFNDFVSDYVDDLVEALRTLPPDTLEQITQVISEAIDNSNQIFMFGNGGSSATPSHSAGDWAKELGARTICLSDNTPALTAWGNDTDYGNIFKGPLEQYLDPGDVVIGYSGSGNSENVIRAIEYANVHGAITIGITGDHKGGKGGLLAKRSSLAIVVCTTSMERIEDLQLVINHIIKEAIKSKRTS